MKFKKYIHFICVSFLLATTSISSAQTSPNQMPVPMQLPRPAFPPQPQNAWTKQAAMELNNTVLLVSHDVKKFFTKYPDFVADTFGGQAYNLKEFFRNIDLTIKRVGMYVLSNMMRQYNPLHPLPISDGMENVCNSPRICLGLQYKVAESILNLNQPNAKVSYFFASINDGQHNFVVALPTGIQPTVDNVKTQGVILDPWTYQSAEPKSFVFAGNNRNFYDMVIDPNKITSEYLQLQFPKDPFFASTDPTPTPTPEPDPTPTQPPVCDRNTFQRDSYGNFILQMNKYGVMAQITANEIVSITYVTADKETGKIYSSFSAYGTYTKCDYEANKAKYLSEALQSLAYFHFGNCLGIYTLPAGTVLDSFIENYFSKMQLICL